MPALTIFALFAKYNLRRNTWE